jgi:hypothetical protein
VAFVLNDRVKETTTTTGTGTVNLGGAATGFETFVAGVGNSNSTYYCIAGQTTAEFEVGIGTVTDASPDTLSRTTILSSSNSDSAVDFSAGTKDVFCTLPAAKTIREFDTAVNIPTGTTAQRSSSAVAGDFRYNTSTGRFEGYSSAWNALGGSNTFSTDIFAGDGSDTTFTLSQSIENENDLFVFIDGVFQAHNSYSVSGTTLTFSTAPANGRVITAYSVKSAVSGNNVTISTMDGDGSDTTLTLAADPVNENNVQVYIDGVYQNKDTFAVSGTTLTFSAAPPNGTKVEAITLTQTNINTATQLADADGDTKVQVEESSDEDTIRMDIAGTEVLTLTNSAMTLKGTTPTLTIGDAGAEDTKIVFDGNAQDYYIGLDDSADDLIIGLGSTVGTTPIMSFDENKDVTINEGKLTTSGANGADNQGINITDTGYSKTHKIYGDNSLHIQADSGQQILFKPNATEAARFDASGNLGIGKTSPTSTLEVAKSDRDNGVTLTLTNTYSGSDWATGDNVGTIDFRTDDSSTSQPIRGRIQLTTGTLSGGNWASPNQMAFSVANGNTLSEAMRIDNSGNVGIGTTAPTDYNASDKLTIANTSGNASMTIVGGTSGESSVFMADGTSGNASYRGYVQYQHTNDNMNFGTAGAERIRIDSSGNIRPATDAGYTGHSDLGTSSFRYEDAYVRDGVTTGSDRNEKENITESNLGLSFIKELQPVSYTWKNNSSNRTHYGLIAQDIETWLSDNDKNNTDFAALIKEDISEEQDGSSYRYGLRYTEFISPLIKAIQEQQELIETLQAKVEALENG